MTKKAKRHDCGRHGQLTAAEAAAIAGISPAAVYQRLTDGVKGDALCASTPSHSERYRKRRRSYTLDAPATCGGVVAYTAARIAVRFHGQAPDVDVLMRDFGMHRATAYRWRAAFVDALGLQA